MVVEVMTCLPVSYLDLPAVLVVVGLQIQQEMGWDLE